MSPRYVGLMSGTSLDGVDGVLVELEPVRVLAHAHRPFAPPLIQELLALNTSGEDELHRAALAGSALTRHYAQLVEELLALAGVDRANVKAIGAHGQTVRHRPGEFDGTGYSLQIASPALLAELTGIDVVCDFRSRDVAAGGQGAPLVPAFHRATFGRLGTELAVLNIGGISNLTLLRDGDVALGFDCGPGNALMDLWCARHTGARFDDRGAWARSGRVVPELLSAMLQEPYFARPPPKSTGRDLFNAAWLDAKVQEHGAVEKPVNVQATLAELTASACATALETQAGTVKLVLACGGGVFNEHLLARIGAHLRSATVKKTDEFGLPATQVEACAFAWLAHAFTQRLPAGLPAVTGARGARVLGALYPAR
jgi:anhydro-N-acetylmuramic acid kinase